MTDCLTPNDVHYFYFNVLNKRQQRTRIFFMIIIRGSTCISNCCVNVSFVKGFFWRFITRHLGLRNQSALYIETKFIKIFLSNNSAYSEVKIKEVLEYSNSCETLLLLLYKARCIFCGAFLPCCFVLSISTARIDSNDFICMMNHWGLSNLK